MKIDILTIFPELFSSFKETSIIGRACKAGILDINTHDIREYTKNKHRKVDDYPYGGGAGMVMMAQPIFDCLQSVKGDNFIGKTIRMTPRGSVLTPQIAQDLSKEEHIIILCGHYEGVDERVAGLFDMGISIGDYVLTGGELASMVLVDCFSRFIPGVLGSELSIDEESFSEGLLEYPQYTRPADYNGLLVPDVLLNGNHKEIYNWRLTQAEAITKEYRPDLYDLYLKSHPERDEKNKSNTRKKKC